MNTKLERFIEKNKEYLELYEQDIDLSLKIYPVEFQNFIEKWGKKTKEIDKIKDINKRSSVLLKSLIEELQDKGKLYNYLNEIYKELKAYKQSNKHKPLSDNWDYFIANAIEFLEENRTPLQRYFYHIDTDPELIKRGEFIKFPQKDLEKILKPFFLKVSLNKEKIRELKQKLHTQHIRNLNKLRQKENEDKGLIKHYETYIEIEKELVNQLLNKEIYLFYFDHLLPVYGEGDLQLIDILVMEYVNTIVQNKDLDNIFPFYNRAATFPEGTIQNIDPWIYARITNYGFLRIQVGTRNILEKILDIFQSEAEQKRKEKEAKEENTEKFYKSYNKNKTQLPILHIISRNNPYLLTPEILRKNEEFKINSYWSSFILQATKDVEIFEPNDIKNLLAILSIKSAYIEHLKKEKLSDEEILKILVIDGFNIPLPMVAEIREISKRKENYQRIINSVDKAQKIQIKGKLSVDIRGEPLEVKKAFSFISEYEEITYKNKKALNIKLSPTVAKLLIEKKGKYYNRKVINNIPDNLLPLYFTLDNFRLNQNIKEKTISKKDLLENSRLIYGKTAQERPDKVEEYLKKKLNKLKTGIPISTKHRIKLIEDWDEVEMYNGEKGIKIIFAD